MRLIDADAVEKQAYDDVHYHAELEDWEFDVVTHYLDHAPTIDAVPVVRCGECKYFHNRTCKIRKGSWGEQLKVGYTDYCSDGERKDGVG